MAESMRRMARECLGQDGPVSMRRHIFQYMVDPGKSFALRLMLERGAGQAFNVCVIMVGHDEGFTGSVTVADLQRATYSIQRVRELYAQANLGLRRIFWGYIPTADAGGYVNIGGAAEGRALTEDFSGPDDYIDLFFVQTFAGAGGWSATNGPCDKDEEGWTGAIVDLSLGSDEWAAILTAHELGHYLGLPTGPGPNNVMGSDPDGNGIDTVTLNSTNLTAAQGSTMRSHCSVNGSC